MIHTNPTPPTDDQGVPPRSSPPASEAWWRATAAKWIGLGVIAFLGFAYGYDQIYPEVGGQTTDDGTPPAIVRDDGDVASRAGLAPDNDSGSGSVATASTPTRTVTDENSFKLTNETAGTCSVQKPVDWGRLVPTEGNTGADLANADKSMYAGNAIQAINTQLQPYANVYQPPLNNPDLYSSDPSLVTKAYAGSIVSQLGGDSSLSFTGEVNESIGDYQVQSVASSTHKGIIYYHRSGFPGDGVNYSYALPMTFALTRAELWDRSGLMVARVAATIRCSATLVARAQSGPDLGGSESSSSAKDANGSDAGYNPQLGTEEVHDPDTGQNYVVSPSTNWSDTGPAGPGYYAPKGGGDYVHLQPGRVD